MRTSFTLHQVVRRALGSALTRRGDLQVASSASPPRDRCARALSAALPGGIFAPGRPLSLLLLRADDYSERRKATRSEADAARCPSGRFALPLAALAAVAACAPDG